jgi:hypothetical protein
VHRPLTPQIDLAASLSHVEPRVISNDYTFSFAGRRYQIVRGDVQAGMKRQSLRVELRLDGELHARYQSRYLEIHECGAKKPAEPATGTFYFAGNRNFLLCLDTTGCPRVRTWRANPRLHLEV